jgi:uncharacterized protein (TIGR02466 family)
MSDMLMRVDHFISHAYIIKKPEFLEVVKPIADKALSEIEVVADMYPIKQTGSLIDESLMDFGNYIAQTAWDILNEQGYAMENFNTTLNEIWAQELRTHGMHVEHIHNHGAQISGFYFLEVPKMSSKPCFHDPNHAKRQINLPEKDESIITDASVTVNYECEPGDLVFFNSWLPHSFIPNASDKPFKFVHFNVMAVPVHNCAIPPAAEIV